MGLVVLGQPAVAAADTVHLWPSWKRPDRPPHYWRHFGRQLPAETVRTLAAGPLLAMNSRSRETLRNSTVTLVANSATAGKARRLGASDVRFMMADGLPDGWLAKPRTGQMDADGAWAGRLLPHKAPELAVEAFADLAVSFRPAWLLRVTARWRDRSGRRLSVAESPGMCRCLGMFPGMR